MKFFKPVLLTAIAFFAIVSVILYSSCEKSTCDNIKCFHGGSCNNGICKCPTGYEDPTCGTLSISRYLGSYAGYTSCNNGAEEIDSVFIYAGDPHHNTTLYALERQHPFDTLYGYVSSNETTYAIFINDITRTNYNKSFHITLQSDNSLVLDSYERDYTNPLDTIRNTCSFVGVKF